MSSCSDHEIPIDGVEVKSALQEITSLLNTVVKRVEKKEKWNKVLISDLMFSEESDDENGEIITVKPLVWPSERVTRFLH